jgi:hypothetical protein
MAHAVVRTDKMYGTDVRSGMVSVKITEANGIDNGCVAILGDLVTDEREVYAITKPTASADFDAVVLIATPEVNSNPLEYAIDKFYNKKDSIARGYRLHKGDIFSVTKEALSAADFDDVAAGNIVELKADYVLNIVESATSGSTVIGKILGVEVAGGHKYFVIEVTA